MDWMTTLNELLALITGLCGLIGTAIGVVFAIKNFIKLMKEKNKNEVWATIMEIADAAMKEAEKSMESGATKKLIVIETVKASCKAAGLDFDDFIDQLNDYIDETIDFVNKMKDNKKPKKTPAKKDDKKEEIAK